MDFYPAIDLRDGKCVRLYQGDYGQETIYGDDPVAQARAFESAGAPWIHVVDLDAARTGEPVNRAVIADIAAGVAVPVQTGGGIRSMAAAEALFEEFELWFEGSDGIHAEGAIRLAVVSWLKCRRLGRIELVEQAALCKW